MQEMETASEKSLDFSTESQAKKYEGMVLPANRHWHQLTEQQQAAALVAGAEAPGTICVKTNQIDQNCWDILRKKEKFLPCFNLHWCIQDTNFKEGGGKIFISEEVKKALRVLKIKKEFFCVSSFDGRKPR